MTKNTEQMSSLASMVRTILRTQRIVIASVPLPDSQTPQTPAPPRTGIAKKACEIIFPMEQVPAYAQKHWFEPEMQLDPVKAGKGTL